MPSHPPGMTPAVAAPVVLDAWGGPDHAPVLLLLHGFSDSGPCWADAIERWRQTFSVVTWDARGHGRSPRFTADQLAVGPGALMVADAVTAAEQLAARSGAAIGVVGHSMGGSTAAGLALARPDLVAALVLEDPALPGLPGGPGENQAEWGAEQVRGLQQIAAEPVASLEAARLRHPLWPSSEFDPWLQAKLDTDLGMTANGRILNEDNAFEVTRLLAVPTLVVTGTDGVIWHADAVAALRSAAGPQVRVKVLEGADHCVRRTRTQEFHALVDPWLRERLGVR